MKAVKILLLFLVVLAGLFFLFGVYLAIRYSFKGTSDLMPEFVDYAITIIGGVLATNLGAVLGIEIVDRTRFRSLRSRPMSSAAPSIIQIVACYIYIFVLLAAGVSWIFLGFRSVDIVEAIPRLSQTLLGVIVGALAVALMVERKPSAPIPPIS